MTIQPFAAGSYVNDRTTTSLIGIKSRLDALTTQLSTGRAAETYGGLGSSRTISLSAHATISALDGYTAAIDGSSTRVKLATASLTQIKTLGDGTQAGLLKSLQSTTAAGIADTVSLARSNLDAVADALNQQAAGQYVFSGRSTDTEPVVSTDTMLNGDPPAGLAGLKDLIAEQRAADLGSGSGRLTPPVASGSTVSLSEDGNAEARANFGFSLLSVKSSNAAGLNATVSVGTPGDVDLAFASQPRDGDRVRIAVLQDDGSQKILDLTARSDAAGFPDSFQIGTDTAANLKTYLGNAKVASAQSGTPPGISATFSGGSAGAFGVSVGTPAVGDSVTLTLGLHDGTQQTITLTAKASADPASASEFAIGASPATTAASLSSALGNALKAAANTALSASSTTRAAQNFFDGSVSEGLAPRRISGNGYAAAASDRTVIWYRGDDSPSDPRSTAAVQIGANRSVAIGAQANEAPIKATLVGLAMLAAGTFTDASGATDIARFQAAASRSETALGGDTRAGSVDDIVSDFAVASNGMADAKTQAKATKAALQDSLDGIDTVSTEEVAAKLLGLQTQLQASYQVTSMLSKLTLVNYLG